MSLFAAGSIVGAGPQIYAAFVHPDEFFSRAATVTYPLSNGFEWWARKLATNIALNLDPRYLFLSFGEYQGMTVARLGMVSLPFLYTGFVYLLVRTWRHRSPAAFLLLAAVIVCLMPAAASRPNPNAMRSSGVWALYPLISACGVLGVGAVFRSVARWITRP